MWGIVKEEAMAATIEQYINNINRQPLRDELKGVFSSFLAEQRPRQKSNIITAIEQYVFYTQFRDSYYASALPPADKIQNLIDQTLKIQEMLKALQSLYSSNQGGGRSKKQRGGTLEQVYNAQGLVTDLATYNDQIVGNTNAPPPFSAGTSSSSITFEMLPKNMVDGLTPPLSAGGATTRRRTSSRLR
jgi:hypothetical protein